MPATGLGCGAKDPESLQLESGSIHNVNLRDSSSLDVHGTKAKPSI